MQKKRWLFYTILAVLLEIPFYSGLSQYIDLSGNNPYINEYLSEDAENWNKSIIYVFYNNEPCYECPRAMDMIYNIYEQNYALDFSYFEINYQDEGNNVLQNDYQLNQPLSIVLLRINDGMARGYYKIENPQNWIDDPFYFTENITTAINNFLIN
jgi:hypothetical protein